MKINRNAIRSAIKAGVQEQLKDIPDVERKFNYFTGEYDEIKQPRRPLKHA